jgi:hypothetical protein
MTAITAPDRSIAQRMDALERANEIRSKRAAFKRDLKAGRDSLPDALMNPPDWLRTAKVLDVLLACPKLGPVKVNKVLATCRMSRTKTVGGITDRQRSELVSFIGRIREGRPSGGGLIIGMDSQRTRALAGANEARLGRSAVKAQILAGETTVADVLREPVASVASMTIFDLLMSQERWGKSRTASFLRIVNIPEGRQLSGRPDVSLTARQRNLIIDVLARDA